MTELVFFVEGRSEKAMLEGFLPKILPENVAYRCHDFEGWQDLEKKIPERLLREGGDRTRFIILRDQDAGPCTAVKRRLLDKCREMRREALVRIACHELESWYLADLNAVEKGLGLRNLSRRQNERKYREPDRLHSPKNELIALTNRRYQEVSGSRAIAPHLDPENTRSRSFAVFVSGVRKMAGTPA